MPQAAERDPNQALIVAAIRGDAAAVARALKEGATVDVRDNRGRTALLIATHRNDPAMARVLIEAGANVNIKDNIEDSPFLYAGAEGRNEILKLILDTGRADLKSTNRYGGTALIPAAHHGHSDTVKLLLRTGIDKDHVNKLGWTALLEAVILGDGGATYVEIVRLLVKAKANLSIADRDGVTPLAHAQKRGYAAIAKILQDAGARQ
ncbi:MAG: ankyrin repeat domain-containing protein [Pseudolabrys sp.]